MNKSTFPINNMVVSLTRFVVFIIFRINAATNWVRTVRAALRALLETWTLIVAVHNWS